MTIDSAGQTQTHHPSHGSKIVRIPSTSVVRTFALSAQFQCSDTGAEIRPTETMICDDTLI
ncbi:hypothetical protein [Rubripirellula tenax]|uniref:hypothetical protein n=1 Tax=Rubripirellula tenax TaxID=2528015 RepID=UPI0011B4F480|nr:hypothetical protein [Rubripirellula tenax]